MKTVHHSHASANNTGFAYFDTFSYHCLAADKGTALDRRPTIDYCRSRDVTVVFNHRIVLDEWAERPSLEARVGGEVPEFEEDRLALNVLDPGDPFIESIRGEDL